MAKKIAAARPRLSVCLIAKNEARFLRNCLKSVAGVADEIVVVDTGSTDGTQEIAREFGAILIEHAWNDDFAEARNVSLRHATGDWALWLDADEEISPETRDRFREAIETAPAKTGAFMVQIHNWMSSLNRTDGGERVIHHAARLFRRTPAVRFTGRIHEQFFPSLMAAGYEAVPAPHLILDHFGYVREVRDEKRKDERTIRLLEREVAECPVPEMRGFQAFNLGMAYSVVADHENAAKYFALSTQCPAPGQQHTELLYPLFALTQRDCGLPEEGLRACEQGDAQGVVQPGLEFARGQCLRQLGRLTAAEAAFRRALALGGDAAREQKNIGDVGLGRYKARYALALTLSDLDRLPEALAECDLTLAECEIMPPAHALRADLLIKLERLPEAEAALRRFLAFQPENPAALNALGTVLLRDYRAEEALPYLQQAAAGDPDESGPQIRLAHAFETLERLPEAEGVYQKLRVLLPHSAEICVNSGRVLRQLGRNSDALNAFADALERDPADSNALFNTGDLLYQMEQFAQAAEIYRAALALRPDYAAGHFTLGNARFQLGEYDRAAESYRETLALEPNHDRARLNLELTQEQAATAA